MVGRLEGPAAAAGRQLPAAAAGGESAGEKGGWGGGGGSSRESQERLARSCIRENWLALREHQGLRRKLLQPHSEDLSGGLPPAPAVPRTSHVSNFSYGERRGMRLLNKVEVIAPDATSIWRNICRLLEKDICGMKWEARDDGDLATEMEREILDQLICEETDELMQLIMV